jgi:hypothetical protein
MRSSEFFTWDDSDLAINPNLTINEETEVIADYLAELRSVQTVEQLESLVDKWSGLIPECQPLLQVGEQFSAFRKFLDTPATEQNIEWLAAQNQDWINARIPPSTLGPVRAALHFGVTTGVVILQLIANDVYEVTVDGEKKTFRLKVPSSREQKVPNVAQSEAEQSTTTTRD